MAPSSWTACRRSRGSFSLARRREHPVLLARHHERLQHGLLHAGVGRSTRRCPTAPGGSRGRRTRRAPGSRGAGGPGCASPRATRVTISRAFGELLWHSTKSARSWSLRERAALQELLEQRDRLLGVAVHEAVERHQLQVLVGDVLGARRLARALAQLELERLRLLEPAALRIAAAQLLERRERLGALALLALRVGQPVEPGVRAAALHLRHLAERRDRAVPGALVERRGALVVELVLPRLALVLARLALVFTLAALVLAGLLLLGDPGRADARR